MLQFDTVSFDFDGCLWDESKQCFISETVAVLREHLSAGDRVIVVTSRVEVWANEARDLIKKFLKLDLEVFSAPGNADDPWDRDPSKSDVLLIQGVVKHFDDLVDCSSLKRAKNLGCEIVLPPATEATVSGCY